MSSESFIFSPVATSEVCKLLDASKSADNLYPYLLKLEAALIATHLFNLSFVTNEIPLIWKSALVFPLFKGGDK